MPIRASSISRFFISMSRFCWDSSAAFSWSSSLVWRSSTDWLCSSWVSDWDCSSSSSVRRLAMIVERETPIVSSCWLRNCRCSSENGCSDPSSITPSTWSSNSTGMISTLAGAACPRPEVTFT